MKTYSFIVIALFLCLAFFLGRPSSMEAVKIRSHADPIAERMLEALSEDNYAAFSRDFSPEKRTAMPEDAFHQYSKYVKNAFGSYTSHKYYSTSKNPEEILVQYIAQYTGVSTGMGVQIKFIRIEGSESVKDFTMIQAGYLTR